MIKKIEKIYTYRFQGFSFFFKFSLALILGKNILLEQKKVA